MCVVSFRTASLALLLLSLSHSLCAPPARAAQPPSDGGMMGRVIDQATGRAVAGASVAVRGIADGGRTVLSDRDGRFHIDSLPGGAYTVAISAIGYQAHVGEIVVLADETVDLETIGLDTAPIELDEIVVTPGRFTIMGDGPASRQVLSADNLRNMSWAEDITRAVTRLPGIGSSDYSSKFTVRGGEADEVLITLDGMELYEPFHQRDYSGGLFSIVDIEAIQGVELMTGGFPAEFGNRLSGVFNLQSKRNGDGVPHSAIGLSPMNARAYTEGGFADQRGSYLMTARRGMLDLIFRAAGRDENLPYFYDAMAKVDYDLSRAHTMSLHLLRAGDRTEVRDSVDGNYDFNETAYGNSYGWLTLRSFFGPRAIGRTIGYAGRVTHDRSGVFSKYEPSDKGTFDLADRRTYALFGLKHDLTWQASKDIFVSAGLEGKRLRSDYDYMNRLQEVRVDSAERLIDFDRRTDVQASPRGSQLASYLSGRLRLTRRLVVEPGIRFDRSSYSADHVWSPRTGIAIAVAPSTTVRAAWGLFYQSQSINNLDVNNGRNSFDPAERSEHVVAGVQHQFEGGIELRAEAYRKNLSGVSPTWQNMRDHLEIFPEARNDNALLISEGGRSQGVEVFLRRDRGERVSWWFSYALAKAEDRIADVDFDGLLSKRTGPVPRLNDQRHTIYADVNYRPSDGWHVNMSWQYYCCWPRTDYTYRYQTLPGGDLHFYPVHEEFNGTTYPPYHRMDVRVSRRVPTSHGELTSFAHLVNVYNRHNLKKFDLDTRDDTGAYSLDTAGNYVPFRDDKYWLGFIPVLGLSWTF